MNRTGRLEDFPPEPPKNTRRRPQRPSADSEEEAVDGTQENTVQRQRATEVIAAEVTNLFDEYYFVTSFDLSGAGSGVVAGQPGRPREWALTVKKTF